MLTGASLAVLALLGLFNGLDTDGGVGAWRILAYPVLALLVYLHGRYFAVRGGGWILAAVAASAVPLGFAVASRPPAAAFWEAVAGLLSLAVVVVLPWLAARSRRQQAELVRAGQREVEQLTREREYVSERARARERARIATDVHDAIGHELALIALRAGALELSPDLSDPNRQAAEALRASAVKATDRLRYTIGMLREDEVPVDPPGERLTALVERAVAAGMDVTLSGDPVPSPTANRPDAAEPDGPAGALPSLVDRAVHRVVREALTNAARYAPGAAVAVRISRTDTTLLVTVANDTATAAPAPAPTSSGSGSGLTGLAERVRLLGGEFFAGPDTTGFVVTARLPVALEPSRNAPTATSTTTREGTE